MNTEKLVKLTPNEIQQLMSGELVYIQHLEKGLCYSNPQNIYVGITELTTEEKQLIGKEIKF